MDTGMCMGIMWYKLLSLNRKFTNSITASHRMILLNYHRSLYDFIITVSVYIARTCIVQ